MNEVRMSRKTSPRKILRQGAGPSNPEVTQPQTASGAKHDFWDWPHQPRVGSAGLPESAGQG